MTYSRPLQTSRRGTRWFLAAALVIVVAVLAVVRAYQSGASSPPTSVPSTVVSESAKPPAPARTTGTPSESVRSPSHASSPSTVSATPVTVWPARGQAAYRLSGQARVHVGPNQHPAAIASVAKVMTAYLVLRHHPLSSGQDGPTITLTQADVTDTDRRRRNHESVVPVAAGELLSERQALQALLLPSANNIAVVLARWDAGSVDAFVRRMNLTARSLGMSQTRYTDPSGYDSATVSTAADQLAIVDHALRLQVFATIVATRTARLPVAGLVHNTDSLLGQHGFVGVKTGSDSAAGGCFAFRAIRTIDGRQTTITGVVLGQPGQSLIAAGLAAAEEMVDRVAGEPGSSGPPPAPATGAGIDTPPKENM
jgi:D-alanyl-D-alanine carboxypeptidase (penicillin-binding protein 5/6)